MSADATTGSRWWWWWWWWRLARQLYAIRNALRAGVEKLSKRQLIQLETGLSTGDSNYEVTIAWQCYQKLRAAFTAIELRRGRQTAVKVLDSFHTCPVVEIARLGRRLRSW
jgi:transposase